MCRARVLWVSRACPCGTCGFPFQLWCFPCRVVFGYEGKSYDLKVVETGGEWSCIGRHKVGQLCLVCICTEALQVLCALVTNGHISVKKSMFGCSAFMSRCTCTYVRTYHLSVMILRYALARRFTISQMFRWLHSYLHQWKTLQSVTTACYFSDHWYMRRSWLTWVHKYVMIHDVSATFVLSAKKCMQSCTFVAVLYLYICSCTVLVHM